jgi:calcineurin-like phosphoesterase family protein
MKIKAFFSDPHFAHANIIGYCNRPFSDIEEMNLTLADNYNRMVGPDDTVVWLGDCFFKGDTERYRNMLTELCGYKILIVGNHDQGDTAMASMGFSLVLHEAVMQIGGVPCRLSHYPYKAASVEKPDKYKALRPRRHKGEILLHGHSHATTKVTGPTSISLGVDAWDFGPAPYDDVASLVKGLSNADI